ncbi:unnamed protein product [Ixodes persulcatus]
MPIKIAVVGAGVVGMATAVRILESVENAQVTVIAESFTPHTTGDVSVGLLEPFLVNVDSIFVFPNYRDWCVDSFNFYHGLINAETSGQLGLALVPVYELFEKFKAKPLYAEPFLNYRDMTPEELAAYPGDYKYGAYFVSISIVCRKFLPYMMQRFTRRGGTFIHEKVESLDQLAGQYDVVMNCSGIGARTLVPDPKCVPVQGQTVRVAAPWVKNCLVVGDYEFLPTVDYVVLRGVPIFDETSTIPTEETARLIYENATKFIPSLKEARILENHVGVRPYREPLRVDIEYRKIKGSWRTVS